MIEGGMESLLRRAIMWCYIILWFLEVTVRNSTVAGVGHLEFWRDCLRWRTEFATARVVENEWWFTLIDWRSAQQNCPWPGMKFMPALQLSKLAPTVIIGSTATVHRPVARSSFLCAAKPFKWIVLLYLPHILFIIISVILNNAHVTMCFAEAL